jgi:hypothetical protein
MNRLVAAVAASALLIVLSPAAVSDAAVARTTITMRIPSCEGCVVYPYSQRVLATNGVVSARQVTNGAVTIVVATRRTAGMVFAIEAPWQDTSDVQPLIAFQYEGYAPGTTVTRPQARRALSASPCWAGTTASAVTFDVAVRKVWVEGQALGNDDEYHDRRVQMPMAWVLPTQESAGPFARTVNGIADLTNQPACLVAGVS